LSLSKKSVEFHIFETALKSYPDKIKNKYLETLKNRSTIDMLGKAYKGKTLSNEEILSYYTTLPNSDLFFAAYDKDKKEYVGTCRLMKINTKEKSAELGYITFLSNRGSGYGKAILEAAKQYVFEVLSFVKLSATTYEINVASCKCFEHTQFKKIKIENELVYYVAMRDNE
tara:strand:- start:2972 stop:3484 length:513 start_codon:yes stop_codon:yes gene_type:complete